MTQRQQHIEQLDDFELSGAKLNQTLDSLGWINRWFGNHHLILKALNTLIKKHPKQKTFKIIDLGCGGGDVLRRIAARYKATDIAVQLVGIDANANSLDYARKQKGELVNIKFIQADILAKDFKLPKCDILISSHFIYHFTDQGLIDFILNNRHSINLGFINSGLRNSKLALFLFKYCSWLLPINKMAKQDGQQAIRSAFNKDQLQNLLQAIPKLKFKLRSVPFFRLFLLIE